LDSWKGKFLFMGGRVIILNSIISAISSYYLSVYRIPQWVLRKIDTLRRRFLWAGVDTVHTKKILSYWLGVICLHKEHGGLSVLDLEHMNISLV
jgi:hypothetical protein